MKSLIIVLIGLFAIGGQAQSVPEKAASGEVTTQAIPVPVPATEVDRGAAASDEANTESEAVEQEQQVENAENTEEAIASSEAKNEDLMKCVNVEFNNTARQVISTSIGPQMEVELAKAANEQEQQQVVAMFRVRMRELFLTMVEPYADQVETADGSLLVEVIDEDIILAYAPMCNAISPIVAQAVPKLDKENKVYKHLVADRNDLQNKVQPELDKIKEIEATIAKLQQQIIEIRSGISEEQAEMDEIDAHIQENFLVTAKSPEEITAEFEALTVSPEYLKVVKSAVIVLQDKFSESSGVNIDLVSQYEAQIKAAEAAETEPAPAAPAAPAQAEEGPAAQETASNDQGEFVLKFND